MPFAITRCSNKKLAFTLRTFVILQAIGMVYHKHFVHELYFEDSRSTHMDCAISSSTNGTYLINVIFNRILPFLCNGLLHGGMVPHMIHITDSQVVLSGK